MKTTTRLSGAQLARAATRIVNTVYSQDSSSMETFDAQRSGERAAKIIENTFSDLISDCVLVTLEYKAIDQNEARDFFAVTIFNWSNKMDEFPPINVSDYKKLLGRIKRLSAELDTAIMDAMYRGSDDMSQMLPGSLFYDFPMIITYLEKLAQLDIDIVLQQRRNIGPGRRSLVPSATSVLIELLAEYCEKRLDLGVGWKKAATGSKTDGAPTPGGVFVLRIAELILGTRPPDKALRSLRYRSKRRSQK